MLKKHNYKKIFLVTEEENYLQKLKLIFKNKLIFYNSYRSNNIDIFKDTRTNHRAKLGEENLIDMLLLKTLIELFALAHLPDASVYFNKKLKNKLHLIDNGNNSKNILIAQFLWKLKIILPSFLGGFK